jgi:hypothetical protein
MGFYMKFMPYIREPAVGGKYKKNIPPKLEVLYTWLIENPRGQ